MAVNTIQRGGRRYWIRSGNASYYVAFAHKRNDEIKAIGHAQAGTQVIKRFKIIEPANPLVNAFGGFGAIIYLIRNKSLSFDEIDFFDINREMTKADILDDYDLLEPLDFMSILGAKFYPEWKDHVVTAANPTPDPRPELYEIPDGTSEQRDAMFTLIRQLGCSEYIHRLFRPGGITFAEYSDLFAFFFTTNNTRRDQVKKLRQIIANDDVVGRFALTRPQRRELLGIEDPEPVTN